MNYGKVIKKLLKQYDELTMLGSMRIKKKDPFYMLISTVLSVRNRDESTEVIANELLDKYPTPEALAVADRKEVERIVKRMGLWQQKVDRVIKISQILLDKYDGKVPDTLEQLLELPGVGTKVAGCVLVYAFDKDFIPADTHVHRISNRLGWVNTKTPPKTEIELMKKIPRKYWRYVNEVLVMHGKNICKPRPLCKKCVISKDCKYFLESF